MVSYVTPNLPPNVFWSMRYRVTRASGSYQVVQNGGVPPTVALLGSKRLARNKRPEAWFSAKASVTRSKRRPVKQNIRETPRAHSKRPSLPNDWDKRPGAGLPRLLSEESGAVSEAGKAVVYVEMSTHGQVHVLRNSRTDIISQGQMTSYRNITL